MTLLKNPHFYIVVAGIGILAVYIGEFSTVSTVSAIGALAASIIGLGVSVAVKEARTVPAVAILILELLVSGWTVYLFAFIHYFA